MSDEEKCLLKMRTGLQQLDLTDGEICLHHFEYFIKKYEHCQKVCVDPGKVHKKAVRGSLQTIDIDMAKALSSTEKHIAPGMKLCFRCMSRAEAGQFAESVEEAALYYTYYVPQRTV